MSGMIKIITKYNAYLIMGTKVTLMVSVSSMFIGLFLGILLAILKKNAPKPVRTLINLYVDFIRGTPVLVQLAMVFYGLPLLNINFPVVDMGGFNSDRLIAGIIAISLNCTAYMCEVIRGGIESIDEGQLEAATALGITKGKMWSKVVLPQALRNALPALGNEFVVLIKGSSQVSVIGLADLMYVTNQIRSQSFLPFSPLVMISIIYLIMTSAVSWVFKKIEYNMNVKRANGKKFNGAIAQQISGAGI